MYGIFVNSDGCVPYADAIVDGYKAVETRNRNMLKDLVGERVAVIRTRRGKNPTVVGYVDIGDAYFCPAAVFDQHRDLTLVPSGSRYDVNGRGKWLYDLWNAERCEPYPLPSDAVRHGRSWCEWGERDEMVTLHV